MSVKLRFLGVGDASQSGLGHASICIEAEGKTLLVDCGPGVLEAYFQYYSTLPDAVFITHCHLDHIADFEKLFIRSWFSESGHRPLVFVPAAIVPFLHERVGTYPEALAEGGVNFWQAFQLIPVARAFDFAGQVFRIYPARHHGINSAFSLSLSDAFYYTGDTRPVPEILEHEISEETLIFHDCSVVGNPSHSGIDDIQREYSDALQARLRVYHYNNQTQQSVFEKAGLICVKPGELFEFD